MQRPMRILLPLFAALFAAASAAGQNVTWTGTAERLDDNAYRIVLEAAIPAGYHMYDMGPYDGGPNATTITFTPNEDVTLEGGVEQLDTPHLNRPYSCPGSARNRAIAQLT